ncbi:hypothetical protein FRC17_001011 [Serendipita sp. 399]|nr:hypothetical protein FRC17_001011 [Serendipita sp. 399]
MKFLLQWGIFAFWTERCLGTDMVWGYTATHEEPPTFTKVGKWVNVSVPVDSIGPGIPLASTAKGGLIVLSFQGKFSLILSRPAGSTISVWVDGKRSTTPFVPEKNSSIALTYGIRTGLPNMFVWDMKTEVNDHQLVVDITASEDDPVIFDIALVSTSGPTFDEWNEAASPSGVWTLTDTANEPVTYSNFGWQHTQQPFFVNETASVTSTPGAWVQLTFSGSGIWVLGSIPVEGTMFSVEVVKNYGREVTRNITTHNITRPGLDIPLYQTNLFVEKGLPYANAYSYNFTLISGTMMIDLMRVDGVPVPAGAGNIWTEPTPPPSTTPNLRIIIPSALCALVLAVLVGLASFFLYKRYHLRRPHRLGLGIGMLERKKEEIVQPFREAYKPPSNTNESRSTKGSNPQIHYSNSQQQHLSSRNTTTNSLDDSLASTHPISSALGQSGFADSEFQESSIRLPLGDYGTEDGEPLSLSHADLAKVFRRAERLRLSENDSGESNALEPQLETLARQLADSGQ